MARRKKGDIKKARNHKEHVAERATVRLAAERKALRDGMQPAREKRALRHGHRGRPVRTSPINVSV